jgi:hypothetical protein
MPEPEASHRYRPIAVRVWVHTFSAVIWTFYEPEDGRYFVHERYGDSWADMFEGSPMVPRYEPGCKFVDDEREIAASEIEPVLARLRETPVRLFDYEPVHVLDCGSYGMDSGPNSGFVLTWFGPDAGWDELRDVAAELIRLAKGSDENGRLFWPD